MLADGSSVPCFLLANKSDTIENRFWDVILILDLKDVKVTTLESEDFDKKRALFDKFVEEKGFSGWYETSGRLNIAIFDLDDMTRSIVTRNDLLCPRTIII